DAHLEQEHRSERLGDADALNDPSSNRTDIGPPVAADLGLVAHSTEAHARKPSPRARAIDCPRLVLPTPGGPTKHRIGSRAFSSVDVAERSWRSFFTARCSRMRSLIFSRSYWS